MGWSERYRRERSLERKRERENSESEEPDPRSGLDSDRRVHNLLEGYEERNEEEETRQSGDVVW
jgi:hypothetical protein